MEGNEQPRTKLLKSLGDLKYKLISKSTFDSMSVYPVCIATFNWSIHRHKEER